MSQSDEVEYSRLAAQVFEIEKLVNSGQPGDVGFLLKSFLHNAKSRMEEIRYEEIRTEDEKKDQKSKEAANVVLLAEMEHRLSTEEKQQYSGFLKLDYFTKANFDELENFYADGGAWDKLSESGKAQMSHRVWEGIRRDEYDFDELPEAIRKKESERLYQQLTGKNQADPNLESLSQQDRAEFIRAHESGDDKSEAKILGRKSFSMNVSTTSSTEVSLREASVSSKKEVEVQKVSVGEQREKNGQVEESAFSGFTLAEASEITKPELSGRSGGSVNQRI